MKIDSHHHFWQYNKDEYSWIDESMLSLRRDFFPKELLSLLKSKNFDGSIVVQARQTLEETKWLLDLAEQNEFIKGVVGWVDLCSLDIDQQLQTFCVSPYFKGVRHVLHDEENDRFMLSNDFKRGIHALQKYDLTYDLLVFPKHLPYAIELVKEFPEQRFVLDHIGKPLIKDQVLSPWRENIKRLAQHKNVFVKLSGMVTEAKWNDWEQKDFELYLVTILEEFGPQRCMIGSDWPVCTVSASYKETIDIVLDYVKIHYPSDLEDIVGKTCTNFYKIV
ncbi:amidohydrolase [Bacillus sp. TS-2]|nr:amidohydrolase [Bacillus sp. TS-2]